jgi:HEAT repeat protein/beta-lactamase regulating signal transducer with metallopeptidase domain
MTHFLDGVVGPALGFLGDWSLRWAVLIALLAAGLAVLRPRRAATRHLVCLAVFLAGLLLPALPRWGPGWRGWHPSVPPHRAEPEPPARAGNTAPPAPREPSLPAEGKGKPPAGDPVAGPTTSAAVHPEQRSAKPAAASWEPRHAMVLGLAVLYATGVLVLLARWVGGCLVLRRLRREAVTVQGASARLFESCRAELGVRRRARLATHPLVRSPLTCGLWRPTVLVPPGWLDLPEPARRGTLLHELAHLARRDDGLALLMGLARTTFFFHPLVHWLLARLECERELLCDERAVARGIDPRDYAGVLLEFARQPGRLGPAALGIVSDPLRFGKRRTVKTRIHHLLEENMDRWMTPLPARRALALGAAVLGLALGLGSFRVRAVQAEAAPAPPGPAQESAGRQEGVPAQDPDRVQPLGQEAAPASVPRPRKEALRYGGKNFDQWRTELVTELKPEVRVEGIRALSAFGTNGYGAEAAAAIVEVMKGYDVTIGDKDDRSVVQAGFDAVAKVGAAAVPVLRDGVRDKNRNVRRFAVTVLARGVPEAEATVPALLAAIRDKDPFTCRGAIEAVENIDPKAKGFIPALTAALQDNDTPVRDLAMRALARRGPSARAAVPALVGLLKDNNAELRRLAVAALSHIKPDTKAVVPALIRALNDPDASVQGDVIKLLGQLGPDAKAAVPALVGLLKADLTNKTQGRLSHAHQVAIALGRIGPAAKEAVPLLKDLRSWEHNLSEQREIQDALDRVNR